MVANLNALSFGSGASSMGNMPVGIPMASARVTAVELFDVVVIQLLFRGDVIKVPPPNHTSNKSEGVGLDNCDLIY